MVINELVAFVVKFWMLGEAKQVISHVQGMQSFFFSEDFKKTSEILSEDFARCVIHQEDFARCVLHQEDFSKSLLTFLY